MNKKVIFNFDFDNTLTTKFGLEFGFYELLNTTNLEFWSKCEKLSKENQMEPLQAWMLLAKQEFEKIEKKLDKETLKKLGQKIEFYSGVEDFFIRISEVAKKLGLAIEFNIISANFKNLVEGCKISKHMSHIYGCEFYYDQNDNVMWPSQVTTPETKVICLNRISKGNLNMTDNAVYNASTRDSVPFSNMFYFGDSELDIPALLEVNKKGGVAIAVCPLNKNKREELVRCEKEKLINAYLPANYENSSELYCYLVKQLQTIAENLNNLKAI